METLTTLDRAIRLQKVDLFSELETDELALVASIAARIECKQGEVLFKENTPSNALYVVLSGRIEMSRGGQPMFTVGPDETVGNWAFFDQQPSVSTATGREDSWLLRIEAQDFFDLLADNTDMMPSMFQALFKRVRSLLVRGLEERPSQSAGSQDDKAAG